MLAAISTFDRSRRLGQAPEVTRDELNGRDDEWGPELLKSRAYEQILVDVIMGALAPGARVDERALAHRYNVGLAGVRDALGRLALEGLVQRRPRLGTVVSPLDLREVEHAFEVRSLLEGRSAALAARNATAADAAAISAAFHGA